MKRQRQFDLNAQRVVNNREAKGNGNYNVLVDSPQVNDGQIIEDAVENAHLMWVPTSPEAKKFVERKRKETGNTSLNENDLPLLQHVIVTMYFLGSAFAVAVFADNSLESV